jgi:hypothetical protein
MMAVARVADTPDVAVSGRREAAYVFGSGFLASLAAFSVYWWLRGSGWDGDTLVMAAQFEKVVNPALKGVPDAGTLPKLLTGFLSFLSYRLTGGFELLSVVAVVLNATAIAVACVWVHRHGGVWAVACFLLFVDGSWNAVVINADSPAFSLPLTMIGLFLFAECRRPVLGGASLLLASLARPGPEVLLGILTVYQFARQRSLSNGVGWLIAFCLIAASHTLFNYRIFYADRQDYLTQCLGYHPASYRPQFESLRHTWSLVAQYALGISKLWVTRTIWLLPFIAIAAIAAWQKRSSALALLLLPLLCVAPMAGGFELGLVYLLPSYFSEAMLLPAILAGFAVSAPRISHLGWNTRAMGLAVLVLATITVMAARHGMVDTGRFEANPRTGRMWRDARAAGRIVASEITAGGDSKRKLRALIGVDYVFALLDIGPFLSEVVYADTAAYEGVSGEMYFSGRLALVLKRPQDVLTADAVRDPRLGDRVDLAYVSCEDVMLTAYFRDLGFVEHDCGQCRLLFVRDDLRQ